MWALREVYVWSWLLGKLWQHLHSLFVLQADQTKPQRAFNQNLGNILKPPADEGAGSQAMVAAAENTRKTNL